jgi:3-hydroxybutyryl-CoA dehydrogenase
MTRPMTVRADLVGVPVLVIGAGIMGAGIAQVAAAAGHRVWLHDARVGAAAHAQRQLAATLDGLVTKGRMTADQAQGLLARIEPIDSLGQAREQISEVGLVVEAIVEQLDAKRSLLRELEAVVGADCVLATNTSSISVTALANGLAHPQRLVGMHFFNPVPLMKLVEVVSGLRTDPAVAQAVFALSQAWGKVPVHARSTPGFIVNRIARPYYAETLALLLEQSSTPAVLDDCLRAAGFRMGPCELMDLIGHDTNFAVTQSVFEANFYDKRFQPSLVQRELVDGGLLGRKSGAGFYAYPVASAAASSPAAPTASKPAQKAAQDPAQDPAPQPALPARPLRVDVHGDTPLALALWQATAAALDRLGFAADSEAGPATALQQVPASGWTGLAIDGARLHLTDGRLAAAVGQADAPPEVAVFDLPLAWLAAPDKAPPGTALAFALRDSASPAWQAAAPAWLAALGFAPHRVADTPGLVVARTVAMLVNEAADAVLQGVCTAEAADAAMKLGVNYPAGPFEWLQRWGTPAVAALIDRLDAHYRGERYRLSGWLRRRALG